MEKIKKPKLKISSYFFILISFIIVFAPNFLTPPEGLPQAGFQVLGVFVGVLVLWLAVPGEWPNLFLICSLMLLPLGGVDKVSAVGLGNATVLFLLCAFMLSYVLSETGISRRVAIWLITRKICQKSSWYLVLMLLFGSLMFGSFLSATGTFLIFLAVSEEIFKLTGQKKGDELPGMIILSLGMITCLTGGMTPISHVITLLGFASLQKYTGIEVDFLSFMGFGVTVGIVTFIGIMLLLRFVYKLDVNKLKGVDLEAMRKSLPPISKREIIAGVVYICVVIGWILPGVIKIFFPEYDPVFKLINTVYPPLIAVIILNIIRIDDVPVLNIDKALGQVPWASIVFTGAVLALTALFSNPEAGIAKYVVQVFTPLVGGLSPAIFILLMIAATIVMTSFVSNAVTLTVVTSVAIPLVLSFYPNTINVAALACLIAAGSSYSFYIPACTSNMAVVAGTGWISVKRMFTFGLMISAIAIATFFFIGYPIANILIK
ncbi:MAG: SLC13 family permease [Clostridiaceae bacterium]